MTIDFVCVFFGFVQWAVESTHSWVSPNPDPPENQDDLLQNPLENHHDSPQIHF
jgi:hypothetical protein